MKRKYRSEHAFPVLKVVGAVLVVLIASYLLWPSTQKSFLTQISHVRHDAKLHLTKGDIFVQLADSSSERELGLSYRPEIGKEEGMLFIFDTPGKYGFWMKDMQFPIDIVWLSQSGQVVYIEENVATSTYPKAFTNSSSALYVLELGANVAHEVGIFLGTKIDLSGIKK